MAWPSLPGLGLGWVERLSQEGRALLGESLSVHIRPPPPVSCLSWLPPPRLTPLRVLPKLTWTPRASNACLLCPLSCFSPSTPALLSHPFILSLHLSGWQCLPFLPRSSWASASSLSLIAP